MTNFEFFKDTILEMASNNEDIAVMRNTPANNRIKDCSVTRCRKCLFNKPNDKTCIQKRYEWFYEEYKETPTLTKREWHFLKVLQHGEIYRDREGYMFWCPGGDDPDFYLLTYEVYKDLFSFCKSDSAKFSIEEMLTWEVEGN